jgi:sensor histidine kinase regulating citrate/malate metabolism
MADALEKGNSPPPPRGAASSDAGLQNAAPAIGAGTGRASSPAEPGEGIGLSIVKRLCDMLDATIELKSEPNVGTSFRILFPRHYAT